MDSLEQVGAARREYRLTTGRKLNQTVLAAAFLVGAGFFFKLALNPIGREFALAVGLLSLILGLMIIVQAWSSRLILDGDRIEVRSAFRSHNARRNEIEGLRTVQNQYGRWTCIYPKQDRGSFNVSDFFTGDDDLQEWLKGPPDLDKRDADEILKDVSLQDSPAQAETSASSAFDMAKAWAIGLSILAGVVSVPVMFLHYEPLYKASLIVLLACPLAGIVLLHHSQLLFTVFKRKPDPRADLGFLIAWPGIGVVFSYQTANDPTHLVDGSQLMFWVLLVFVGFLAALFHTAWKRPGRVAVLFFLAITGGIYSIGLANAANI